jgi:hypothetical protein
MADMQVKIFDSDNLPGRRLHAKTIHASRHSAELGREMVVAREQMARRIAELIVQQPDFFKVHGDGDLISQWANLIVLTDDELAEWGRQRFKDGLAHARGFMPPHDVGVKRIPGEAHE